MNWTHKYERYFVFDPEGHSIEYYNTEKEMFKAANDAIKNSFSDGYWGEYTDQIICGKITHSAQKTNVITRPPEDEIDTETQCDESGIYWEYETDTMCGYEMKKIINGVKKSC